MNEQKQIAQDAVFLMACAIEHLDWLRGVLHVLRDQLDRRNDGHHATVADLALYNVDDWRNQLDYAAETLEARIATAFVEAKPAPQNPQYENLARIPEGPDTTLAERLLLARESTPLSQADLARLIGAQQTSISQIESGKTKRTSYLAEIARACKVDMNWLAFGSETAQ